MPPPPHSLTLVRFERCFCVFFFINSQIKIFLCFSRVLRRRGCVVRWHRPASKLHKSAPWNFSCGDDENFLLFSNTFKNFVPFCVLQSRLDVKNSLSTYTHMDSPFCAYENAYFALTSISSVLVRLSPLYDSFSHSSDGFFSLVGECVCVMLFEKCIQNRTLACVDAILRGSIHERDSYSSIHTRWVFNEKQGEGGDGKSADQKFYCCCLSVENVQWEKTQGGIFRDENNFEDFLLKF